MSYIEFITWIMEPVCVEQFLCCWCILWFGLIVHLGSARHKTSRRVSWCQLWMKTESGEWSKNSLVKWWWGEWNLDPASNSPTRKRFLYLSHVFLLIPGNLPFLFLMKGHLSGCSALVPHWRGSQYKVQQGLQLSSGLFFCQGASHNRLSKF